jgi:hypothetical protein
MQGWSVKDISYRFAIAPRTIKSHI